jgi:hypothetical protein
MLTERLTPVSTFFWSPHVTPGARERLACFLAVRNYDAEDELMREKKIVYIKEWKGAPYRRLSWQWQSHLAA